MSKKKNKNEKPIREGIMEINDICDNGIELWDNITPEEFGFVQATKQERIDFWYNTLFEDTEELEEKGLGFCNRSDYFDRDAEQERAVLAKTDKFYIVYGEGEITNGCGWDTIITQIVTNNYDEAKKYFDSLEPETVNPKDEIKEAREKLGDMSEYIWIDVKSDWYDIYFKMLSGNSRSGGGRDESAILP